MSRFEILKQFRSAEEIDADEAREIADNILKVIEPYTIPLRTCYHPTLQRNEHGVCCDCGEVIPERREHSCACGHDLDDEHYVYAKDCPDGNDVRMCSICEVGACITVIGEREAYEGRRLK